MRTRTLLTTMLALGLLATACGGGPASGSGATVVDDDTPADAQAATDSAAEPGEGAGSDTAADAEAAADAGAAEDADEPTEANEAALGTRDNPLPLGTRIEMGEWTLAVTEVNPDAADEVLAENQFNDPPVEGRQFVLFTVDATYEGDDSGTAWLDLSWAIVGSAGNTFGTAMDDYCGVIPRPLNDTGETFPGGSVTGNVCVSVDSAQVDGATIRIEESFSFDDTRAFFALP